MGCGSGRVVTKVLVGLHEVGIVGLREAFEEAEREAPADREAAVLRALEILDARNWVPESQSEDFRRAVWREYLRRRGEDLRSYFSRLEVTVRGEAGGARDALEALLASVLGDFELAPVVTHEAPDTPGANPKIVIAGEEIAEGPTDRRSLKQAIRKRIAHW